jgi:adenylate cyclase
VRSEEEIFADIQAATAKNDAATLFRLADEMEALDTPGSSASAIGTRGNAYRMIGDFPAAMEQLGKARVLHAELGNTRGLAVVALHTASVHTVTGYYEEALAENQRALEYFTEGGDLAAAAVAIGNMGNVYLHSGSYPEALEHYRRALQVHEELGDRHGVARVTGNMGNVHHYTGEFSQALEHYHRALVAQEELGVLVSVAHLCMNIGILFKNRGSFPEALEYTRRSLSIHEELGGRDGIAEALAAIGNVYSSTGSYPEALEYLERALVLNEELGNRHGIAYTTSNLGTAHSSAGDHAAAAEQFRRAREQYELIGDHSGVTRVTGFMTTELITLGEFEEAASLIEQQASSEFHDPRAHALFLRNKALMSEHHGDLEAAQDELQQALSIVKELGARGQEAEYHLHLRDLAQKRNDFAAYIEHNTEHARISEEIRGRDATQRMAMLEAERKMEAERREREKERALLHGALPQRIAERMLRGESVSGDQYESAGVIFLDIVGFTTLSALLQPHQVVLILEKLFTSMDAVMERHGVMKIKTIGDSYMAVAFPDESQPSDLNGSDQAVRAAHAALDMLDVVRNPLVDLLGLTTDELPEGLPSTLEVRIGIHCGPVTAGVIGTQRLQYDVWGDTVNVASRMESSGLPGRVNITKSMADLLAPTNSFVLDPRGSVEVKGKGAMEMFFLGRA